MAAVSWNRVRPRARLLGWDENGVLPLVLRVVFPSAAVALAIALALGPTAVWLTGVVTMVGLAGWILRHSLGVIPATLHSVDDGGAALGADASPSWGRSAARASGDRTCCWRRCGRSIIWGEGRCLRVTDDWFGIGLLGVADLGWPCC